MDMPAPPFSVPPDDRAEEIFLQYVGTLFEIDDKGRIWRIAILSRGSIVPCERRRAEYPSSNGYLRLRMMLNGVRIRVSAHRIVYRYFNGDIPPNWVVDHNDSRRANNHPSNLKPLTQSHNIKKAVNRDQCNSDISQSNP